MLIATSSGWGAVVAGLVGLGVSLFSLVAKARLAAEVRGLADRLVSMQMRRVGHRLNLDDPNDAAQFLEEWNAELAELEGRPISRIRFALTLRRASHEVAGTRDEARDGAKGT